MKHKTLHGSALKDNAASGFRTTKCMIKVEAIEASSSWRATTCKDCLKEKSPPAIKYIPRVHLSVNGKTCAAWKTKTLLSTNDINEVTCKVCLRGVK